MTRPANIYYVCTQCNAKWFAPLVTTSCPRCDCEDILAEEMVSGPPWQQHPNEKGGVNGHTSDHGRRHDRRAGTRRRPWHSRRSGAPEHAENRDFGARRRTGKMTVAAPPGLDPKWATALIRDVAGDLDALRLVELADRLRWAEDRASLAQRGHASLWGGPAARLSPLRRGGLSELHHGPRGRASALHGGTVSAQLGHAGRLHLDRLAPDDQHWWEENSGRELSVPIGRAGAKELLAMELGRGTSQHVLISGKTGSGKSTLLHALITNLALRYGPDQVEFYLVDFKKGVEFKAYANGQLPHARVIAIESEREFGVSVLQRLDAELKRRGELFRARGVQDLAGFRAAAPDEVMPRTLLIIDEFQELFVTDDRLAQDSSLLLDRLVRQGRAFGIHVLLGSQTLAGAYSLARSTIGQMAVRVALECSEADAHLILSDENTAARLLNRPGEAIYNDQNGLVAGNHPFQVVWLPDAQRQQYLAKLLELSIDGRMPTNEPPIVFEGNVPANPLGNAALVASFSDDAPPVAEANIWLGSAVRIEPPTQLILRRQGGHNFAVVGQQEPLALGVLAGAVIALAGQQRRLGAKFTILDGARPESPEHGTWSRVAAAVGECVEVVAPRSAPEAIAALADEVARRGESPDESHPPRYLVIHDLAQFRDLRQTDDDFGFSFSGGGEGQTAGPDKRFREILKEGPVVGVHVLLWCESYNSLSRAVDRLTLREIEFRVAQQMSAADSTSVIDSPSASQLGEHRAILYRDDLGTEVKFRPYGSPSAEWLQLVSEHLASPRVAAADPPE